MQLVSRFYDNPLWANIAAFAAGLLMPLGFAPFAWHYLPFIALAVLLSVLRNCSRSQAILRGVWFGLAMFGFGVSWVYNSLHDFGAASVPVSVAIAAGLVIINTVYIGLLGYWMWCGRGYSLPVQALLLFPALWLLMEWLRSWVLSGFPWLLVGYSQMDTWVGHYAPIGGTFLCGAIVAFSAGVLVLLIQGAGRARYLALGSVAILILFGMYCGTLQWTYPVGRTLNVSLVQGNIPQAIKLQPDKLDVSLNAYQTLSRDYYASDVIIWPETAVPTFQHRVQGFIKQLNAELQPTDTELLTGVFSYDFQERRYYNSLYHLGNQTVYHKQRLVPFGEYMPFRELLAFMNQYIKIPLSDIAAATQPGQLQIAGYPVAASICYESAYASVFLAQLPAAAILINVSNDAWFGDSLAPFQHLEISRARARETGRYLLRATNTGISAIIDDQGRVVQRSPQFQADVLTGAVPLLQGTTPFVRTGYWPVVMLALAVLLLLAVYPYRAMLLARLTKRLPKPPV